MSCLIQIQKLHLIILAILLAGCDGANNSSSPSHEKSEPHAIQVSGTKKDPTLKNVDAYLPSDVFTDPKVIALAEAIRSSDQQEIERLLAQGVDINAKGKLNFTPFHFTMHFNDKKIFLALLKHGADPNIRITQSGECITSMAAMVEGDSDWLKMVLEHGGDPNITDPVDMIITNETPIFKAIFARNLKSVELLIDAGADLNHQTDNGSTAVMYAAGARRYQIVYTLLQAGADWKIINNYGYNLAEKCYMLPRVHQKDFPVVYEYYRKVLNFLEEKGVDLAKAKNNLDKKMGRDSSSTSLTSTIPSVSEQPDKHSSLMPIYVTPYYNSKGLQIDVGKYSQELTAATAKTILDLASKMKKQWGILTIESMYVTSIRLYDLGHKNEAVYWFYSAQFRSRLLQTALPEESLNGIGSEGFERIHAHYAFNQLVGKYINGYAFGDLEMLKKTIERVKSESATLPQFRTTYPNLQFIDTKLWPKHQKKIAEGLEKLLVHIEKNADKIKAERKKNGIEDKY